MNKTVCIVDSCWAGSIITFHKIFVDVFLKLGCNVVSLSPAPDAVTSHVRATQPDIRQSQFRAYQFEDPLADQPAAVSLLYGAARRLRVDALTGVPQMFRSLRFWKSTARQIKSIEKEFQRVDLAFLPFPDIHYLGPWLQPFLVEQAFPFAWSALYLGPIEFRMKRHWGNLLMLAQRNPGVFRARNCLAVGILDEGIKDQIQDRLDGKPIMILPDVTDERLENEPGKLEALIEARAGSRLVIGLFGELSLRKGILTFLAAARLAAAAGEEWFFVCAGPLDGRSCPPDEERTIREAIAAAGSNCLFHLERIPDGHEYNAAVRACGVLYAAYWNVLHSSNALLKAAICQKPVIASKGHCVEERIRRYGLGVCIDERDAEQAVSAIRAVCRWQDVAGKPLRPDFATYRAAHAVDRLEENMAKLLARL